MTLTSECGLYQIKHDGGNSYRLIYLGHVIESGLTLADVKVAAEKHAERTLPWKENSQGG